MIILRKSTARKDFRRTFSNSSLETEKSILLQYNNHALFNLIQHNSEFSIHLVFSYQVTVSYRVIRVRCSEQRTRTLRVLSEKISNRT